MIVQLRKWYNAVDRKFDREVLHNGLSATHRLQRSSQPVTAVQAFESCLALVQSLDAKAQLKRISAGRSILVDGTSSEWNFLFDLPLRRAKAGCHWSLPWLEDEDRYGSALIKVDVKPFPARGSQLYLLVDRGQMLYRQLNGMWKDEMARTPALPLQFRNSDQVMQEALLDGMNPGVEELSFQTMCQSGKPAVWSVETRVRSLYIPFAA